MASEAQSAFDYGSHQVKFRVRCCIPEILTSYAGQAATVESVDHFSDTVCDVPCFTCMSEGRAYGCLVEANLHVSGQTMVSPHVGEGTEYGLGDEHAIFYVCLFITVTLNPAAKIFKCIHII